jgi:hypothetical protein
MHKPRRPRRGPTRRSLARHGEDRMRDPYWLATDSQLTSAKCAITRPTERGHGVAPMSSRHPRTAAGVFAVHVSSSTTRCLSCSRDVYATLRRNTFLRLHAPQRKHRDSRWPSGERRAYVRLARRLSPKRNRPRASYSNGRLDMCSEASRSRGTCALVVQSRLARGLSGFVNAAIFAERHIWARPSHFCSRNVPMAKHLFDSSVTTAI